MILRFLEVGSGITGRTDLGARVISKLKSGLGVKLKSVVGRRNAYFVIGGKLSATYTGAEVAVSFLGYRTITTPSACGFGTCGSVIHSGKSLVVLVLVFSMFGITKSIHTFRNPIPEK